MPNQFLANQEYANTMLLLAKNQLVWGKLVYGEYQPLVSDQNGLTVSVKRPPRFVAKSDGTANLALQDVSVGSVPIAVNTYDKVHISVGDIEYVQNWNALMQNTTMQSVASTLAHRVDLNIANLSKQFSSWVAGGAAGGVGGTNAGSGVGLIQTPATAMSAHTRLMTKGVPNDGNINAVVGFDDAELMRGSLSTSFMADLNQTALQRVRIPIVSEANWYASQHVPLMPVGTRLQGDGSTTGATISGAAQNVNYRNVKGAGLLAQMNQTLVLAGVTPATGTILAGEVFTIQNVFAWDWRANQQLPYLQQFTVVAAATASVGAVTVTISPPIIVQNTTDGVNTDLNTAFATAGTVPVNGAFVRFVGVASSNLAIRAAFHKRAIAMVSVKLQNPFQGDYAFAQDPETGISIRYWRSSDISTGNHIHRWDMLYGLAVIDEQLGTRLCGFGG